MNIDEHGGWSILGDVLGTEVSLNFEGPEPSLGPIAAAWLTLLAHRLRDRARATGALSVRGGSVTLEARMEGAGLSLRWEESNGPAGDPGPAALRLLAPRGMRAVLEAGGSGLSLQIRIPAASLAD